MLPGASAETQFGQNARAGMQRLGIVVPEPYTEFAHGVFAAMGRTDSAPVTFASDVAEAIWRAANDPSCPVRLPAGADARELIDLV